MGQSSNTRVFLENGERLWLLEGSEQKELQDGAGVMEGRVQALQGAAELLACSIIRVKAAALRM